MNKGLKHIFFSIMMRIAYRRSRDKDKRIVHNDNLDVVRLQYFAKTKNILWRDNGAKLGSLTSTINPPSLCEVTVKGSSSDYASAIIGKYENTRDAYLMTYFGVPSSQAYSVAVIKHSGKLYTFDDGEMYVVDNVKELIRLYLEKGKMRKIKSVNLAQWSGDKFRFVPVSLSSLNG